MGFTPEDIRIVWAKGNIIVGYDPAIWRRDRYGAAIYWQHYGNRNSEYGWEIDHINPVSNDGSNRIGNLQPLHWKNNAKKQDN